MQEKTFSTANFSDRLQIALRNKGLKPTPLAKKLGLSTGYLSDLINGAKLNPSLETIRKLSRELGCAIKWLESGEGPMVDSGSQSGVELKQKALDSAGRGEFKDGFDYLAATAAPEQILESVETLIRAGREKKKPPTEIILNIVFYLKGCGRIS